MALFGLRRRGMQKRARYQDAAVGAMQFNRKSPAQTGLDTKHSRQMARDRGIAIHKGHTLQDAHIRRQQLLDAHALKQAEHDRVRELAELALNRKNSRFQRQMATRRFGLDQQRFGLAEEAQTHSMTMDRNRDYREETRLDMAETAQNQGLQMAKEQHDMGMEKDRFALDQAKSDAEVKKKLQGLGIKTTEEQLAQLRENKGTARKKMGLQLAGKATGASIDKWLESGSFNDLEWLGNGRGSSKPLDPRETPDAFMGMLDESGLDVSELMGEEIADDKTGETSRPLTETGRRIMDTLAQYAANNREMTPELVQQVARRFGAQTMGEKLTALTSKQMSGNATDSDAAEWERVRGKLYPNISEGDWRDEFNRYIQTAGRRGKTVDEQELMALGEAMDSGMSYIEAMAELTEKPLDDHEEPSAFHHFRRPFDPDTDMPGAGLAAG